MQRLNQSRETFRHRIERVDGNDLFAPSASHRFSQLRIAEQFHPAAGQLFYVARQDQESSAVQDDDHFHVACRYVERNALTAGLVELAEDWRWGSLWNWCGGESRIKLPAWPVARLPNWIERVNQPLTQKELAAVERSVKRNCPLGTTSWIEKTAKRLHLESTTRPQGRPKRLA